VWDGTFDGNHNSKITWDNLLDQSADWAELYLDCMIGQTDHQRGVEQKIKSTGTVFKYNDVRVNVYVFLTASMETTTCCT
jgi:hypothetical protein